MIVVNRFRVESVDEFQAAAEPALAVLLSKPGLTSLDLVQNLDEPDLWALVSHWDGVGSYRRALSGFESKAVVVPFLSRSIDEPSAFDDVGLVGENRPRGS